MSNNSAAIGMAVGCGTVGGTINGATVVGIINHGYSPAASILLSLGLSLLVVAFMAARDAIRGS